MKFFLYAFLRSFFLFFFILWHFFSFFFSNYLFAVPISQSINVHICIITVNALEIPVIAFAGNFFQFFCRFRDLSSRLVPNNICIYPPICAVPGSSYPIARPAAWQNHNALAVLQIHRFTGRGVHNITIWTITQSKA